MRVTILGSGSQGNAVLLEAGGRRLLVDAGLSARMVRRRMKLAHGRGLDSLDAIVLTHAHRDHSAHADTLGDYYDAPVWMTQSTQRGLRPKKPFERRVFGARAPFDTAGFQVRPLPVPHDAPNVALVLERGDERLGYVTDCGHVTSALISHLEGCSTLMVEANHDPDLLRNGPYPAALKARVAGAKGHLSNGQCGELLRALGPGVETVVLMHLSEKNNSPRQARSVVERALAGRDSRVLVSDQRQPLCFDTRPPKQLAFAL